MKNTIRFTTLHKLVLFLLLILSLLAVIKSIFMGMSVDEEYAITMSYRALGQDSMFLSMWEPHQTSGFPGSLLIRLYLAVAKDTAYLAVYLRICGILLQLALSVTLYLLLSRRFPQKVCALLALSTFSISPKWILMPDFSNLLLWSCLLTGLMLLQCYEKDTAAIPWVIVSALSYCVSILAYPSCLILLPVYLWILLSASKPHALKRIVAFLLTCFLTGACYLACFLSHMSVADLVSGLRQMALDGKHSVPMGERLLLYLEEFCSYAVPLFVLSLLALAISFLLTSLYAPKSDRFPAHRTFLHCFVYALCILSMLHQGCYWLLGGEYLHRPYLFYYVLYFSGLCFLDKKSALFKTLWVPAGFIWFAAILLTNTGVRVTALYLFPGIVASLLALYQDTADVSCLPSLSHVMRDLVLLTLCGLLICSRGWLVCGPDGHTMNALYVKQKALSGPGKGIYFRYTDGFEYNAAAELLNTYATQDDSLLVGSMHSLYYMLSDAQIATYSTISTPTFDERLQEYWALYPEKYPTLVLLEENSPYREDIEKLLPLDHPITVQDGLCLYRIVQR